jgi:enoyl-CoA hydratase/3-hydroxyacyl-CoA dehydrogenase
MSTAKKSRYEAIATEKEEKTLWITLNRPHRLNTFNLEMIEELSEAIDEADEDDDTRCIVIKGEGDRAFSAGADLIMFSDITPESAVEVSEKGQRLMDKIERSPKPFIAAIHGFCLGGGLELALACDFRLASESAELGATEIKLGIIPGWGGTQRLSRLVGTAKAKEFIMLGDRVPSEEAVKIGLVHKTFPQAELIEESRSLARRLAEGPSVALKLAKRVINFGSQKPLEEGLKMEAQSFREIASTDDVFEGISAFYERRKPEFK